MISVDPTLRHHKNMESNHRNIVRGLDLFKQTWININSVHKTILQYQIEQHTKNKHKQLNENLKRQQISIKQHIFDRCNAMPASGALSFSLTHIQHDERDRKPKASTGMLENGSKSIWNICFSI